MSLQYISDDAGNHTAVIIPIKEWDDITAKHKDLKALVHEHPKTVSKRKPSDFAGTLSKEEAEKFLEYVEQTRNEWERGF